MSYTLAFAVAIIGGMVVTERGSPDPRRYRLLYVAAVAGGVAGARLLHAAQYGFFLRSGGMSLFGFCIGAFLTLILLQYLGRRRTGVWPAPDFADAVAPALAFGVGVQRIGCFVNGCCFGSVCDLPWAVTYGPGSPAFQRQISEGLISPDRSASLPIHPTQLYESLTAFIVLGVLLWLRRYRGQWLMGNELFLGLAGFYGAFRFGMEFLRDDSGGRRFGQFTFAQGLSLLILLVAASVLIVRRRRLRTGFLLLVLVGFAGLSGCRDSHHPVRVIAHRGLTSEAPENSLPAIFRALEIGCCGVEVDVRLTLDRVPVLLHDARLERTTDGFGPVGNMKVEELRRLVALSGKLTASEVVRIPLLSEALDAVPEDRLIVLDLKTLDFQPVVEVVRRAGASSRIAYVVYRPGDAEMLARLDPDSRVVLSAVALVGPGNVLLVEASRLHAVMVGLDLASLGRFPEVSPGSWILNLPGHVVPGDELRQALDRHPWAIITDRPAQVLETLGTTRPAG